MQINTIKISNFKSLKFAEVSCRKLTVTTGLNSSGKSSLLQALFILRATYMRNRVIGEKATVTFETPETGFIGAFQDLLSYDYEGDGAISMAVDFNDGKYCAFQTEPYRVDNKADRELLGKLDHNIPFDATPALFGNNIQYLSALRTGPADYYPTAPRADNRYLGKDGRFAANLLERYGNSFKVHPAMCLRTGTNVSTYEDLLFQQMDIWMSHITSSKNIHIKVTPTSTSEVELSYSFTDERGLPYPRSTRPINVGFGVSCLFPVLVALLTAQPGDLLIIENPESDLHARAQSRLGELMALAARAGVQLIVETHSEHIINGIRIQVKSHQESKGQVGLDSGDVAIHYFVRSANGDTSLTTATLYADAGLSIKPGISGFFDQIEEDLLKIL